MDAAPPSLAHSFRSLLSGDQVSSLCLQLPRAVSTQALSGAGFLKMINKATDAVSKMTIKMNESDVVSSGVNGQTAAGGMKRSFMTVMFR